MNKEFFIILLITLLVLQPLTFGVGFAQIPEQSEKPDLKFVPQIKSVVDFEKRSIKTTQDVDNLLTKYNKNSARVIVELNDPNYVAEVNLKSAQKEGQRNRILGAQDTFINSLQSDNVQNVKKLKTAPYIAMTVDKITLEKLLASESVKSIREDTLLKPSLVFSIPLIGADVVHLDGTTGTGRNVAILDTGVDSAHPFFGGRVVSEACFSTTEPFFSAVSACPSGADIQIGPGSAVPCGVPDCDHGTHVAGIAAGDGASDGVARGAGIVAIQVFSEFFDSGICGAPSCALAFTSDIIAGLDHVLALKTGGMPIDAANLSLGGGLSTTLCPGEPEEFSIMALKAAGVATVVASGNDGSKTSISFPACVPDAISVGATSAGRPGFPPADTVAFFSNSFPDLDLLGPGFGISSSVPGGGFAIFSGTSMATPHVTGAYALLRQVSPGTTVDFLTSILKATGVDLTDVNGVTTPRIDMAEAVAALDLEAKCGPVASYSAIIFGTPGNDRLVATVKAIIIGDAGNDQIRGSPFDDCILTGEGDDTVSAGDGNDKIYNLEGNDSIKGGPGDDTIFGGPNNDRISGGSGSDTIEGGDGADSIKGGDDNDSLKGGNGPDKISGGDGNDMITGEADNDQITGRAGNDTIDCGLGTDVAAGDDGIAATNPADVDILDPSCESTSPF